MNIIITTIIIIIVIIILINLNKSEHFSGDKQDQSKLNAALIKITKELKEYDINNWFIAYGTLLGIVRDNSCIKGDDDIDIIVDRSEEEKLRKLIKEKKYKYDYRYRSFFLKIFPFLYRIFDKKFNYTNFVRILDKNNIPIEFYIAYNNNNNYKDTWENIIWSNVNPIIKKKWNNTVLNLPNDYIKKLEKYYGVSWKIKQKRVRYNHNWQEVL